MTRIIWGSLLALSFTGCIPGEQGVLPCRLEVQVGDRYTHLAFPVLREDDTIAGYDSAACTVVLQSRSGILRSIPVWGAVSEIFPLSDGHIIATMLHDTAYFLSWRGKEQFDTIGKLTAGKGIFVQTNYPNLALWRTSSGAMYLLDLHHKRMQRIGMLISRSGAWALLSMQDSTIAVLESLTPALTMWEVIHATTGRRLSSGFIPSNLYLVSATVDKAVSITRGREGYNLEWYTRSAIGDARLMGRILLPLSLYEPQAVVLVGDTALALFRSGIAVATPSALLGVWSGYISGFHHPLYSLSRGNGKMLLVGSRRAMIVTISENPGWWIERSVPLVYRLAAVVLSALALGYVMRRIWHHRRLVGALLEKSTSGSVLIVDRRRRLRRLNTVARALLGIKTGTPLHRSFHEYFPVQWSALREIIDAALSEQSSRVEEIVVETSSGQRRFIVNIDALFGGLNRFEGVLITILDVTAQFERWRMLNWAEIAHDMQTHLTTIRLTAENLERTSSDEYREQIHRILRQTTILIDRVRDLLALGRGDGLLVEECSIEQLLQEVVEDVKMSAPAHISFVVRPSPLVVRLDRRRMARAIHNALTNAVKAIENSSGTIDVWAELTTRELIIGVRDTGRGMDEETLQRFSQPYFTTSSSGHGIGSLIMQRMAELHGGTLEVQSQVGRGTTVLFHLPRSVYVRHQY
ncbi:MAG: HAMP domain-containing sensor histidine kinase [Bacteroidota bacterium]|nr:HAMP domain-containing histidine kinase [Candidatus Kapabacteria bacterium]MDW8074708.1 HAMP domain-containing sensor histidine kinase [Bacteroidota bacterium]